MPIAGDVDGPPEAAIFALVPHHHHDHPALDRTAQGRIALALRQMYAVLVDQPIPERFIELLVRSDQKQRGEP